MTTPRALTNFRKTALVAGIAISLSALWDFIVGVLTGPHGSSQELAAATALSLFFLMLELPLPVLLVLLSGTGIRRSPSRNLQCLIAALIVIRCVSLLLFVQRRWQSGILPDISRIARSAGGVSWFILSPGSQLWAASFVTSHVLTFISRLLFVLFLVAFATQHVPAHNGGAGEARQVKKAALAAMLTGAITLVIDVFGYWLAMRIYGFAGPEPGTLSMLRGLVFELPAIIVPSIIYRSIRKPQIGAGS